MIIATTKIQSFSLHTNNGGNNGVKILFKKIIEQQLVCTWVCEICFAKL